MQAGVVVFTSPTLRHPCPLLVKPLSFWGGLYIHVHVVPPPIQFHPQIEPLQYLHYDMIELSLIAMFLCRKDYMYM